MPQGLLEPRLAQPKGPTRRLYLFGGGPRPAEAVRRFARSRSVLVIAWASECPRETAGALEDDFQRAGARGLQSSISIPRNEAERTAFQRQLLMTDGIFFSGGDQNRIMEAFGRTPDRCNLLQALRHKYRAGCAFGGTSAGTAVMSSLMIAGDRAPGRLGHSEMLLGQGLGLLPVAILDQHFLKRQRQNRLFGAVLASPHLLGLGIDEGAALIVRGERRAEAVGGQTLIVDAQKWPGALHVEILHPGDRYDLKRLLKSTDGATPAAHRERVIRQPWTSPTVFSPAASHAGQKDLHH